MCFKWIVNNLEKDISNIHMHKTVKKLVYVDNYGKKYTYPQVIHMLWIELCKSLF